MNISEQNYVFIVGCARTGSKLHADMLNAHPAINLVDELHFLAPAWVRKDFRRRAAGVGPLTSSVNLGKLVEQMYSGELSGTFWNQPPPDQPGKPPQTVFDLDRAELTRRIGDSGRRLEDVFACLIEMQAELQGKAVAGAKFPVDIGSVTLLRRWFPQARIIHLVRDPRAIYASMVSMDSRHGVRNRGELKKTHRPLRRLVYLVSRYRESARLHQSCQGDKNYFVSDFEQLLVDPQRRAEQLAEFLNIDYLPEMLKPRIRNSSFGDSKSATGFDAEVNNRWKQHLSSGAQQFLNIALRRQMRVFNYLP